MLTQQRLQQLQNTNLIQSYLLQLQLQLDFFFTIGKKTFIKTTSMALFSHPIDPKWPIHSAKCLYKTLSNSYFKRCGLTRILPT